MAIAIDQATIGSKVDEVNRSTYTLTTSAAVASGGFVVLGFQTLDSPTTINTITDNGPGLSWSVDKTSASTGWRFCIASAQAPSGMASGTVISVALSASGIVGVLGGCSFTGVKTSSPVDGTPLGPTVVSAQAWSTGNYTVQAGSVIVGYCVNNTNGSANTPTAPSLEVFEGAASGNDFGGTMEYRIESSAGSVPVAGSWGTSATTINIGVAYLAAATAVDTGLAWIVA